MITKYTVRHYPAAQVSYTYGNHPGHLVSRGYAPAVRREEILNRTYDAFDFTNHDFHDLGTFDTLEAATAAAKAVDLGEFTYSGPYNGYHTFEASAVLIEEIHWKERWGEPSEDLFDWDGGDIWPFYSAPSHRYLVFVDLEQDEEEEEDEPAEATVAELTESLLDFDSKRFVVMDHEAMRKFIEADSEANGAPLTFDDYEVPDAPDATYVLAYDSCGESRTFCTASYTAPYSAFANALDWAFDGRYDLDSEGNIS